MAFLTIRHPDDKIENISLSPEKELIIGRASDNAISFPKDPKVSARHCRIYFNRELGGFVLSDLRSTNGTILNLNRIAVDVTLRDNDKMRIGDIRILYREGELEAETASATKRVFKLASRRDAESGLRTDTCVIPNFSNIKRKPKLTIINDYTLTTGEHVDKYQILRKVADFQFGSVYSALGPNIKDGSVALKIFNSSFDVQHPAIAEFNNAIEAVQKVDNPYFVRTLGGGVYLGHCYLLMDFVAIDDLNMKIALHAPFPEFEALSIAYTVASALETAFRENGIIHGMLSPASVLIDGDDNLMIKGHGLCKWMSRHISQGKPVSLPWYTSPEQAAGQPFDWQSDVYALGIMLFQLLTGAVPFHSPSDRETLDKQIREPLPLPQTANPNITASSSTLELLERMTAKNPANRFASWQELLRAMESSAS